LCKRPIPIAQKDRHGAVVVAAQYVQVGLAIPVEIPHYDSKGSVAQRYRTVCRLSKRPVSIAKEYRDGAVRIIRNGEIRMPSPLKSPVATDQGSSPAKGVCELMKVNPVDPAPSAAVPTTVFP